MPLPSYPDRPSPTPLPLAGRFPLSFRYRLWHKRLYQSLALLRGIGLWSMRDCTSDYASLPLNKPHQPRLRIEPLFVLSIS